MPGEVGVGAQARSFVQQLGGEARALIKRRSLCLKEPCRLQKENVKEWRGHQAALGKDSLNGHKIKRCRKWIVSEGQRVQGTLGEVRIREDLWVQDALHAHVGSDNGKRRRRKPRSFAIGWERLLDEGKKLFFLLFWCRMNPFFTQM